MFATMLALLAQAVVASPQPSLSGGTVTETTAGACDGTGGVSVPAAISIGWSVANADAAHYNIKVYENDVLMSTRAGNDTAAPKTITGYVHDEAAGVLGSFTSHWTYRLDMVRIADGVVVSTRTTAEWVAHYHDCSL